VVALSDPEAEFAETLVKARALIDALLLFRHGRLDPAQRQHILTQLAEEGVAQL
jgi:para-aminobenzoate synthetase